MLELYQAAHRVEAQMLKDYLDLQGIETVIVGDYLSGAVGELPADIFPTLWVLEEGDLERAKQLTERFFHRSAMAGEAWRCDVCGESIEAGFELCWNCGSPNPNDKE
ncbi:MAG: DUF2007 domain-containing protein [Candidatus Thiodiazotropha sp.]